MCDPAASFETERGSRARDHRANERTLLVWLRTAANVMVLGLAVAKFVQPDSARTEIADGVLLATGAKVLFLRPYASQAAVATSSC